MKKPNNYCTTGIIGNKMLIEKNKLKIKTKEEEEEEEERKKLKLNPCNENAYIIDNQIKKDLKLKHPQILMENHEGN